MLTVKYTMDISNHKLGYYLIILNNDDKFYSDNAISEFLGIDIILYHDLLITKFNGYYENNKHQEIFFLNEDDVLKAKEWLEENINSFLIAKKLTKNY